MPTDRSMTPPDTSDEGVEKMAAQIGDRPGSSIEEREAAATLRALSSERAALRLAVAEVTVERDAAEKRLEVYATDSAGTLYRMPEHLDGIACRDATIRLMQDEWGATTAALRERILHWRDACDQRDAAIAERDAARREALEEAAKLVWTDIGNDRDVWLRQHLAARLTALAAAPGAGDTREAARDD